MNSEENHKLDVLIERVDWIRGDIKELRDDFKCQIDKCNERFTEQDKKISKNNKIIYWILGVLAASGITTGTIMGVT